MDEFTRALAFIEGLEERAVSRIEAFEYGRAFFLDDFPVVWDDNFARIEVEPPSWPELRDTVEEIQRKGGLSHRKMHFHDTEWVKELSDLARGDGWEATSLIFMVRRSQGERDDGGRAIEVSYSEVRKLRYELARRQPWATSEDDVRQVIEANRRWMNLIEARHFAVEADGKLVAAADLYRAPGLSQIEDVETMKEYRGRGYASDIVLTAAEVAVREDPQTTVFLIADEGDWPKKLYQRMGFETVGRKHQLLKTPGN